MLKYKRPVFLYQRQFLLTVSLYIALYLFFLAVFTAFYLSQQNSYARQTKELGQNYSEDIGSFFLQTDQNQTNLRTYLTEYLLGMTTDLNFQQNLNSIVSANSNYQELIVFLEDKIISSKSTYSVKNFVYRDYLTADGITLSEYLQSVSSQKYYLYLQAGNYTQPAVLLPCWSGVRQQYIPCLIFLKEDVFLSLLWQSNLAERLTVHVSLADGNNLFLPEFHASNLPDKPIWEVTTERYAVSWEIFAATAIAPETRNMFFLSQGALLLLFGIGLLFIFVFYRDCRSYVHKLSSLLYASDLPDKPTNELLDAQEVISELQNKLEIMTENSHKQKEENSLESQIVAYMIQNFAVPDITVLEIAEHFHMSVSSLTAKVKNATGYTVNQYIILLRMNEARKLLATTDLKIKEIAEQVGYLDATSFNRKFKSLYDISPSEFRKQF